MVRKGSRSRSMADKKNIEINTKQGKASNRRGIQYAAREAGRAAEHFEPKTGEKHSHGSRKAHPVTGPRRKTKEQRIVSG
jgi:hypothetical protein